MTTIVRLERGARWLAFVLVAWLGWSALHPVSVARSARARIADLPRLASTWARDEGLSSLHVTVDGTPDRASLGVLAALRRAGTSVTWDGPLPPFALSAEPVADPSGTTRIAVAGGERELLRVSDALGAIDSVRPSGAKSGVELLVPDVESPVEVGSGAFGASAAIADSLIVRSVLVIGRAGWESKFTVAALEERGWQVVTELSLAPDTRVGHASAAPIDTGRYTAVVALDTSAASRAPAIARYVRAGGGLVLAGSAATLSALAPVAPAALGARRPARPMLVAGSLAPRTLARWALAPRAGAVTLGYYGADVAVAARVAGAGRVIQTGAEETWRWRMEGAEGSPEAHREWWSRLVAAVAYAPAIARPVSNGGLPAPRAATIDALGNPGPASVASSGYDPLHSPLVLAAVFVLLLTEWTSRRLRGAR